MPRQYQIRMLYYFHKKVVHNLKAINARKPSREVSRMIHRHIRVMKGLAMRMRR